MNTGILSKSTSNAYWYHGILIFTRAYSQPESEDIESLQSCQLLEECEQNLKSLQNYKESLDRVISKYPDIRQYLKQNLLPFPADFQYQIFRTGNFELYLSVMSQMAILFNIWRRRHYDKSTLSFLSDCDYQKNFLPEYWQCKQHWLYLFVEKKIEIWHSLLRAHTQSHDNGELIEKVAKTVASTGFLANFWEAFVPGYLRGKSSFNFWLIAGKTAEFILQIFLK